MDLNNSYRRLVSYFSAAQRFKVSQMSGKARRLVLCLLVVAFAASVIILLHGFGLYPSTTAYTLPVSYSPIDIALLMPFSLNLFLLLGTGVSAAVLTYVSYSDRPSKGFVSRTLIALFAFAVPLAFLEYSYMLAGVWPVGGWVQFALILIACGCGAVALVLAILGKTSLAPVAVGSVGGAFLALILAYILITWWSNTTPFNTEEELNFYVNMPPNTLALLFSNILGAAGVIFFWQALTEAKLFSRDIGFNIASRSERAPRILGVLLIVKLVILAIGFTLAFMGLAGEVWLRSISDAFSAWIMAAGFVIVLVGWLAYWRRPVRPVDTTRITKFFAAGFLLPYILGFTLLVLATILAGIGFDNAGLSVGELSVTFGDIGTNWTLFFALLLIPIGLLAKRSERYRFMVPILLLSGLWALPIIINYAASLAGFTAFDIAFDYLTFDTILTIALLGHAIALWRKGRLADGAWSITTILVVSTLVALLDSLIPQRLAFQVYAILLVLPLFYEIFLDAEELNLDSRTQPRKLIGRFGFQAMLMVLVAWGFVTGQISSERVMWDAVAARVFIPPLLMIILGAAITSYEENRVQPTLDTDATQSEIG